MNTEVTKKLKNVIGREKYLRLLQAALSCKSFRFGRQAALSWLAIYPGDLDVVLLQAEMLAGDGKLAQAVALLEKLIETDPENADAYEALARATYQKDDERFKRAVSGMKVLGARIPEGIVTEEWTINLSLVRKQLDEGEIEQAQENLHLELGKEKFPLLAIANHLQLVAKQGDAEALLHLAELYQGQYPNCLPVLMHKVDALMDLGKETEAVQLLHQCVSMDLAGVVARRMWGNEHSYKMIWPEEMAVLFDIPIPAEVAVQLSGAWLPVGEPGRGDADTESSQENRKNPEASSTDEVTAQAAIAAATVDEANQEKPVEERLDKQALSAIEREFEKLAKHLKRPVIGRSDGRYPVYVIFSSWTGLETQYGPQTANVIDLELRRLAEAVHKRTGWDALVFYPDQEKSTSSLGLQPVSGTDPWKLKLSLGDLDKALSKKGEMIGTMVIVGGPQVVPFHELPNPTDDFDEKILSDNPYGTLDSNYFVPEWPLGRLPGETGPDAGLLIEQLRCLIAHHNRSRRIKSLTEGSIFWPFVVIVQGVMQALAAGKAATNIGYTAAVWRRSSTAVFKPVGNPANIMVSPPEESKTIPGEKLLSSEVSYYNLHGMEDSGEWYGQRDPSEPTQGPDYPVALSPMQLKKNGHAPRVVFSEACYGGHILNKSGENALSLKFLSLGTQAVVASTCIAYGAISTPLVAADLLGNYFWQQVKSGHTAGEALMIAKIDLAREMVKRQGYLDAEDQKTLLSFVLYGDPLAAVISTSQKRGKSILRMKKHAAVKTVDEKPVEIGETSPLSFKVLEDVKSKLAPYLPGIETAEIHISTQEGGVLAAKAGAKAGEPGKCYVVTIHKEIPFAKSVHRHYARATVAPDGKVIKLAVSR
jgi:tetratricopeptide (TPR) repeat protein